MLGLRSRRRARRLSFVAHLELLEQRWLMAGVYVAPTGNDNNPGTEVAPFQTLQKCAGLCADH